MSRRKRSKSDIHSEIIDAMNRGFRYKRRHRERDKHRSDVDGISNINSCAAGCVPNVSLPKVEIK